MTFVFIYTCCFYVSVKMEKDGDVTVVGFASFKIKWCISFCKSLPTNYDALLLFL